MNLAVVVLAAGRGVRMHSNLPKVLHPIGGIPMLARIISTVQALKPAQIVIVYGEKGELLQKAFQNHTPSITFAHQTEPLGTGHAVMQALPYLNDTIDRVLILCGDVPLIQTATLDDLLKKTRHDELGLITATLSNPFGFGRIVRDTTDPKKVLKIVEEKNAIDTERKIQEINAGFYVVQKSYLTQWLPLLSAENPQKEYCLPDIVTLANNANQSVVTKWVEDPMEVMGVNDKVQLAEVERHYQLKQAKALMLKGVTVLDPARLDVRGTLSVGKDVTLDVNVVIEGHVVLGDNVTVGPNVYLKDATLGENVRILSNTVIDQAIIGAGSHIGPFARIRPETVLSKNVHVGNFVEIKKSHIGQHTKINHLSYVGDATVGESVNIGAGTITCNYDGYQKHQTIIEDRVFIGSDTQLIAPVEVGEGATIGAGTTVSRNVPKGALVHNRLEHRVIPNWTQKTKSTNNAEKEKGTE